MKKVESIWAELSAKAQEASKEVENTQEVELSEEQVELASVKALKTYIGYLEKGDGDLLKLRNQMNAISDKIGKISGEFTKKLNSHKGNIKNAEGEVKDVMKALKDLGVDSGNPDVQKAEATIKDAKQGLKFFQSLESDFAAARKSTMR